MPLPDYRVLLVDKLRDTAGKINTPSQTAAIQEALKIYGRVRSQEKIQQLTGDGATFTWALASDFEEGFSRVNSIEHPVDQRDPEYLDQSEYRLYRDPATGVLKLRLIALTLATGKKAYVAYTTRHVVAETSIDTVPVSDREAITSLAAAFIFRQLAAFYAQTSEPTISADAVSYRTKSQEYLALAKALEAAYRAHLGITGEDILAAASVIGDLDAGLDATGGGDGFFHSRRHR